MIQRRQYQQAESLLSTVIKQTTDVEVLSEARHLSAVCCQKQGQLGSALSELKQLVEEFPDSVRFLNAYANALLSSRQEKDAEQYYAMAVNTGLAGDRWQQRPEYRDAWLNWLVALVNDGNSEKIQNAFARYRQQPWQDHRIDRQYAAYLRQLGDLPAAEKELRRLVQQQPNYIAAHHDLAVCLRLQGNSREAIQRYSLCAQAGLDTADFWLNFGNALSDEFILAEAVQAYSRALQHQPFFLQVHENLCDLLYEAGHHDQVFVAYQHALSQPSAPLELWLSSLDKGLRMGASERVCSQLEQCLANGLVDHQSSSESRFLLRVAQFISMYQQPVLGYQSADIHSVLLQVQQDDLIHLESQRYVELCLAHGASERALHVTTDRLAKCPADQAWLALASVQPKHAQLAKCLHSLVFEYHIQLPSGYPSLTAYLTDLADLLRGLHLSIHQPLEQTVHKGTQTRGNLFDNPHPLIQHIAAQYRLAALEFLQHFNDIRQQLEPYVGFWPRPDLGLDDIDFAGSWSVKLSSCGYHSNHFHPMGWLSSALYIEVPPHLKGNEGAFQFGQPNFNTAHGVTGGYVTPEPGKLLLFPSCLWHGTVPFTDQQDRLSIACDLVVKKR